MFDTLNRLQRHSDWLHIKNTVCVYIFVFPSLLQIDDFNIITQIMK